MGHQQLSEFLHHLKTLLEENYVTNTIFNIRPTCFSSDLNSNKLIQEVLEIDWQVVRIFWCGRTLGGVRILTPTDGLCFRLAE